jgi:hypothetical protein
MALFFGYPKIFLWTAEKRDKAPDVHIDRGRKKASCRDERRLLRSFESRRGDSAIMYEMNAFP